jgi:predicted TIM-barrel fold metal-dependent hydrolase
MTYPQVAINDKTMYPIYAACIEEGLPIFCTAGVPGPRVPFWPQKVEHVDEVCWFFPELKFVMRHGAEPWDALACKPMLKYPNLFYSTSAFAPKHYPKSVFGIN